MLQVKISKLSEISDAVPELIAEVGPDKRYRYVNKAFERWFGISKDDIEMLPVAELVGDAVFDRINPFIERALAGEGVDFETDLPNKSGEIRRVWVRYVPMQGQQDGGFIALITDITERARDESVYRRTHRAMSALSAVNHALIRADEESELYKAICDVLNHVGGYRLVWVGLAIHDDSRTVQPVAQAGYEDGYLETLNITWADSERGRGPTGLAIRSGEPQIARNILHDPSFLPWRQQAMERGFASSISLPLKTDNELLGAVNIYSDIADAFDEEEVALLLQLAGDVTYGILSLRARHDRDRAQAQLQASEKELSEILNTMQDTYYRTDMHGRITRISPSVSTLLGYTLEELMGSPMADLYYDSNGRVQFLEAMTKGNGVVKGFEAPLCCKDGSVIWVSTSAHYVFDENRNVMGIEGVTRDITKKKHNEQVLQERERSLKEAQALAKLGSFDWNLLDDCETWSDELFHLLGFEPQSFSPTHNDFLRVLHPDEHERVGQLIEQVMQQNMPLSTEMRIVHTDGSERSMFVQGVVHRDDEGRPVRVVGTAMDITERKRTEKERENLQKQLLQAQKMESIGQLTGGIAHDFNNILTSVMGYTDLAMFHVEGNDPTLNEYLVEIYKAGERARDLIRQMLTFSRGSPTEFQPLQLPELVNGVVKMLRPAMPSSIDIRCDCENILPEIAGDPVQLDQVVMNLCINARDAISESGTIYIAVEKVSAVQCKCSSCFKVFDGEYISVAVRDTGEGISPELLPFIFEPFYTTKEPGKGTGMGLSTVHGIVHDHGGHIELISPPDKGVEFRLFFPIAKVKAGEDKPSHETAGEDYAERLQGRRILVLDDEEAVANFVGELLISYGAMPVIFYDADKAIAAFEQDPLSFDLISTDYTMPAMNGIEVLDAVKRIRPGIPVLICTGYSEQVNEVSAKQRGANAFLMKPLESKTLVNTMGRLLV